MSTQLQLRKGNKIDNDAFTGAEGEMTYDTTTGGLRIHDGVKQGGNLIDVVIDFQLPTAENNYTWYRKYSSGWVEQGGQANQPESTSDTAASINISLPIEMADNKYAVLTTGSVITENTTGGGWGGMRKNSSSTTTTLVITSNRTISSIVFNWEVKGLAA